MSFSENLKRIRKDKGMSQADLAEKTKLSEISIRKYESGERNPKLETMIILADALNVPFNELNDGPYIEKRNGKTNLIYSVSELIIPTSQADHDDNKFSKNFFDSYEKTLQIDKNDFSEEELNEIRQFVEFVKSRRNKE